MSAQRVDLAELAARELHPDDWVWITPEERAALVEAVQAAREYADIPPHELDPAAWNGAQVLEAKVWARLLAALAVFGDESPALSARPAIEPPGRAGGEQRGRGNEPPLKRPGSLTRSRLRRKPKRRDPDAVAQAFRWGAVVGQMPLVSSATDDFSDLCWPRVERHHPIPRSVCRKHGAPEWDPRNGMLLTENRHRRHHNRAEPIRRDELPASVFEFVADHPALRPYLDRIYPT